MIKSKLYKIIFKRIRGRVVPIDLSKAHYKTSHEFRKQLKKKISAKTSLSEQRIKAIRAIRKTKNRYGIIGFGAAARVKSYKNLVIKYEVPLTPKHEFNLRALTKSILSKKGKAPETFLVQTKKKSYLVEKSGKIKPDISDVKRTKFEKAVESKLKIETSDLTPENFAFFGKKMKTIDTGGFFMDRKVTNKERKRLQKFIIRFKKGKK